MKRLLLLISALSVICLAEAGPYTTLRTVVIDAGHGGHDPGGVSTDKRTYEKDIVLDIARMLAYKIGQSYPEMKVLLTRNTDDFVTLNDRAVYANKAEANLFISIHINASRNRAANGFSLHVLGQSSNRDRDLFAYNMDVCRMENSVILLENDYTTKYQGFDPEDPESFIFMQLMQNSNLEQSLVFAGYVERNLEKGPISANRGIWQNPFYVLWKTSMPAVLVELGFITNDSDLAVMKQASNREKFADCLYRAFAEYKASYDASTRTDTTTVAPAPVQAMEIPEHSPEVKADSSRTVLKTADKTEKVNPAISKAVTETAKNLYGIQIFCISRLLKSGAAEFKGLDDIVVMKSGNLYKYVAYCSDSKETALSKITEARKYFSAAFLVKISPETEYFHLSE